MLGEDREPVSRDEYDDPVDLLKALDAGVPRESELASVYVVGVDMSDRVVPDVNVESVRVVDVMGVSDRLE